MEIIVVEVKLLTSNMSNCWSTGSNWFSCGVVYFYKFILPLIHRFGRRSQKRLASAGLFYFFIYRLTCNVIGHCTKLDWIIRYEKEYHWYDFRQSRKAYTSFYNASDPDEYGAAALYDCGWGNCCPRRRCPGAGCSGCPYIDVQICNWIYWRGCSVFIRACIMAWSHALCFSSLFLLQKEIASISRLYGTYWKRDLLSADLFFSCIYICIRMTIWCNLPVHHLLYNCCFLYVG